MLASKRSGDGGLRLRPSQEDELDGELDLE